jgi:16S rRNA (adenine1518-N6/adenine1519-N6)-dimethyltransferase
MVSIRKELKEHGLVPRKRWGQHFLVDRNIINKVVRTAQIGEKDHVLEVGPGLGEMTLLLSQQAKRVIAVEIDPKLVAILREKTASSSNIEIIEEDILKLDFKQLLRPDNPPIKVVANLPYQISTPLLFRFIESRKLFSTLTLMLQREVAERLEASPGGKAYGPLSVSVQVVSDLSVRFFIKPAAFFPPPKVESAVVQLEWRERPLIDLSEETWLHQVVRACFGYRRKTLINALKHSDLRQPPSLENRMENIGIDPRRRPETLTIQDFIRLAEVLRNNREALGEKEIG